ncbi:hypothetical protein ACIO53_42365 [Streptomyces sp. NPDC087305]|uniref:hypothetical protein n=1 Tax=Streptomyces sp. NPDC087305 TaxID=3365781 RepID=UPI00382AF95E
MPDSGESYPVDKCRLPPGQVNSLNSFRIAVESEIIALGCCSGINGNAGTPGAVTAVVLVGGVLVVVLFSHLIDRVSIMTLDRGLNGHFVPGVVLTRGGEGATEAPAHFRMRAWEVLFVLSGSLQVLLDKHYPVWHATLEASA